MSTDSEHNADTVAAGCQFMISWVGYCKAPSNEDGFCGRHAEMLRCKNGHSDDCYCACCSIGSCRK